MPTRIIWDDTEIDLLVLEGRRRNHEFYYSYRGNKIEF